MDTNISGLAYKIYAYICFRIGINKEWEFYNNEIIDHFKEGIHAFRKARDELLDNGYLEIVKQNGWWTLRYASDDLKNNREIVLEAIKQNGLALEYASESFRNDKDVVLEAIKKCYHALCYASDDLKDDKEIVLKAIKKSACY
jgi:hypothetical protein